MSYNGVGLQTPRGTGTSGYIQKNVANNHVEGFRQKRARDASEAERREVRARMQALRRSAGKEVKEHLNKRQIEVKCMELRDRLEDEDVDEETIKRKVDELRKSLLALPKADASEEVTPFHEMSRRELVERQDMEKRRRGNPSKADIGDNGKNLQEKKGDTLEAETVGSKKDKGDKENDSLEGDEEQKGEDEKSEQKSKITSKSQDLRLPDLGTLAKSSSAYEYVPRYGKR